MGKYVGPRKYWEIPFGKQLNLDLPECCFVSMKYRVKKY